MYLEFKNLKNLIYCRKWVLNISPVILLWFQPVIKKKNRKWVNGEETLHPSSTPSHPSLLFSILTVIIVSIRSEEVLLFLVLLIYINTHNRMEINL